VQKFHIHTLVEGEPMGGKQIGTRVNVYVPGDLKSRMDSIGERVNWSGVACAAFERKLLELQSEQEAESDEALIARLAAAQELEEDQDYAAGLEAGRRWARRSATARQMRRIAEYAERVEEWWDVESPRWNAPFGASACFAFAVWPDRNEDRQAPAEFWEGALAEEACRVDESAYLRGFGEGVLAVWSRVADRL
jgi:hypothetical protein